MGCKHLFLVLVVAVLLRNVEPSFAQVATPFDPAYEPGVAPAPIAPPVTTPPVAAVDPETGEMTDGRPDLREWTAYEQYGIVTSFIIRAVIWLMTPICLLLEIIFDWLGFAYAPPIVSFAAGTVGWIAGMVDAWIPLHEYLAQSVFLCLVYILWGPFRILIKYLVPGLG